MAAAHLGRENLTEIHPFHVLELALVRKGASVCHREKSVVFKPHKYCSVSASRLVYAKGWIPNCAEFLLCAGWGVVMTEVALPERIGLSCVRAAGRGSACVGRAAWKFCFNF